MDNKLLRKRICAYLIDILLVASVSYLITFIPINKTANVYENYYEDLLSVNEKYKDKEITEEEYLEVAEPISYKLSKYGVVYSVTNIMVAVAYYIFIQYKMNGQTLGKKITKIRVVANDGKLSLSSLTLRGVVLYGILSSCINIVWLIGLPQASYIQANQFLEIIQVLLFYGSVAMVVVREDSKGLHDVIAGTHVILVNEDNDEIKEAVIEEKVL